MVTTVEPQMLAGQSRLQRRVFSPSCFQTKSSILRLGSQCQMKWANRAWTYSNDGVTYKNPKSETSQFLFNRNYKTVRIFREFEQLSSLTDCRAMSFQTWQIPGLRGINKVIIEYNIFACGNEVLSQNISSSNCLRVLQFRFTSKKDRLWPLILKSLECDKNK